MKKKLSLMLAVILILQIMLPMFSNTKVVAVKEQRLESNIEEDIETSLESNSTTPISESYKSSVVKNGNNEYISNEEEEVYTEEYIEWTKLSDEEKKTVLEPRKEYVPFDTLYEGENININTEYNVGEKDKTILEKFFALFQSTDSEEKENVIPSQFNLKDELGDILVESQSPYNTCYAYPALNAIETNIELTTGERYDFSEMHIEYITSTLLGGSRKLDSGGNFETVMNYSMNEKGPVLESDIPKKNYSENEYDKLKNAIAIAKVNSYKNFPTLSRDKKNNYSNEELNEFRSVLKSHIMNYGTVYASIYFENTANYYNSKTYAYSCLDNTTTTNHAITIVGWNDNYSKYNFPEANRPSGNGAYIAINSWGNSWGDNGYFYISYEDVWVENQISGVLSVDLLGPTVEFSNYTDTQDTISATVTVSDKGKSGINENSLKYVWLEKGTIPTEENFKSTFTNGENISINTNENLVLWIFAENNKGLTVIDNAVTFKGGDGSDSNPYLIETPEQLDAIRNNLSANYKLTKNIDLEYDTQNKNGLFYNNGSGWKEIGTVGTDKLPFSGVLDGNGYSILNLYGYRYKAKDGFGLFGTTTGTVKNIGLYNCDISSYEYVGGITGYNKGEIENVYVSGKLEGHEYIGGIVGENSGNIQNCYNTANVAGQYNVGGISGTNTLKGQIINIYNVGNISGAFNDTVANIVGSNSGSIKNAYYINEILNAVGTEEGTSQNINNVNIENMENDATYNGFDFTSIWELNNSENYNFATLKAVTHIEKENDTENFAGGNGMLYNPYLISTPKQLDFVRNDMYANYKLINNIDLEYDTQNENGLFYNHGKGWIPLGRSAAIRAGAGVAVEGEELKGTFNGNGYSILNLYINNPNEFEQGLFWRNRGLIENFGLVNCNIDGNSVTAGIASKNYFVIQNVYTTGIIDGAGVVYDNQGKIKNAYNTAYTKNGAGIANKSSSTTSIVENVYNVGRTGIATTDKLYIRPAIIDDDVLYNGVTPEYRLKNAYYLDDSIKTGTAIKFSTNSEKQVYELENIKKLTIEEFEKQESFEGFDFANEWKIINNGNYKFPVLKNVTHIEKEENTTDFAGGNGTYYNPYLISNPTQLNNIREDLGACYKLINNIDLGYDTQNENGLFYNNGEGWKPIGDSTNYFTGILDGDNYRILNMKISNQDLEYVGLFGEAQYNIITNLKMTYSKIDTNNTNCSTGSLVGFMYSGFIYNTSSSGEISGYVAGGILGKAYTILVKESYNSSSVNGYYITGGIIGSCSPYSGGYSTRAEIKDSYNIGSLKSLNNGTIGGIMGRHAAETTITNVYNIGTISDSGRIKGNIIGDGISSWSSYERNILSR